jgi:hypothetical protein
MVLKIFVYSDTKLCAQETYNTDSRLGQLPKLRHYLRFSQFFCAGDSRLFGQLLAGILLVLGQLRPEHQGCTIFGNVVYYLPNDTVPGDTNPQHEPELSRVT